MLNFYSTIIDFQTKNKHTMEGLIDRIDYIIKDKNLTDRAFEKATGKGSNYLNSLRSRGSSPSVSYVNTIVEAFPEYSVRWLVTGQGEARIIEGALNEPSATYNKKGKIETAIDEAIIREIEERVTPKIKELYESIEVLLKRGLKEERVDEIKKKA